MIRKYNSHQGNESSIPYNEVPAQHYGHLQYGYNQSQQHQIMVQVPRLTTYEPITPTLTQYNFFAQSLNQLAPYEIQLNLNVALASRPLELTHLTIGTTSAVTTCRMYGMKNDDPKVEELDLELRL
ncbi:hypothetical protein RDI58_007558 [Solanum bulbocastanum]|uniref:Uncharacterized protein n=1 Tax=Solanum bulbocastanum TaxID=147425 RepID=A0AAN8TU70_SOLBU